MDRKANIVRNSSCQIIALRNDVKYAADSLAEIRHKDMYSKAREEERLTGYTQN